MREFAASNELLEKNLPEDGIYGDGAANLCHRLLKGLKIWHRKHANGSSSTSPLMLKNFTATDVRYIEILKKRK